MKRFTWIAFAASVAIAIVLAMQNDITSIFALLGHANWLFFCVIPLRCITLGLDVRGWQLLVKNGIGFYGLFAIACVRDAINRLLPVSSVGGEVIGAHLLAHRGVGYPVAISSIIVELTLNLIAQALFLAFGVACLLQASKHYELRTTVILGIAGVAIFALAVLQILANGVFFANLGRLGTWLMGSRMTDTSAAKTLAQVASMTRELTSGRLRLAKSLCWQLSGLIIGSAENWLVLRSFAHPIPVEGAIALESLTLAARSIFFIAPAGIGVQEASLIALGSMLGLGSDVAMALSVAKRSREIAFGVPALIAWQFSGGAGRQESAPSRG